MSHDMVFKPCRKGKGIEMPPVATHPSTLVMQVIKTVVTGVFTTMLVHGQDSVVLIMDIDNTTIYTRDVADYSRLASEPGPLPTVAGKAFGEAFGIGDIVSIDGRPVKGTFTTEVTNIRLVPNPQPGQAVADTNRTGTLKWTMEVLKEDGSVIGVLYAVGLNSGGPSQIGAPRDSGFVNMVIVGGTGSWLGMRGEAYTLPREGSVNRNPSMKEDPARRLQNGAFQLRRHVLHLVPMRVPTVLVSSTGIAAFHSSDMSPVTADRPARPGEVITLRVGNLGPTVPNTDPGAAFPAQPLAVVNSPVEVKVGREPADVINQVGWPGQVNEYRVDVRVPSGLVSGRHDLRITAAFIPGPAVPIPVAQ